MLEFHLSRLRLTLSLFIKELAHGGNGKHRVGGNDCDHNDSFHDPVPSLPPLT